MKITSLILSLPPYLSTTWKNISSLSVRGEGPFYTLLVFLQDQSIVEVPHLPQETIHQIFDAHARYLEEGEPKNPISFSLPLKPNGTFELLENSAHHNPEQSDLPPLPPEVLKKITAIARIFGLEDASSLTKAEPDCNCIYCQITRSLQGDEEEEEVSLDELKFREWDVKQTGEQFYAVTNPLDSNEQYNVFLGTPIGCTCGHKDCEHIKAVLSS